MVMSPQPGQGRQGESKQAVSYLRVSSKKQMDTAVDIDADGNSIATQRETTTDKAHSMSADVIREFVEPGASATTIDKRPVFKELLQYLIAHPSIDYVIVYMRSRAFRNHFDAAIVGRQLEQLGVRLLSVKEDFGEGPHAVAMEGFTDIMNGLQNTLSGLDIQTKLKHKAVNGGTIGRARLGYLNTRAEHEGRLVNTVTTDPKRASLVRRAWELYATGEYSIDRLQATMADLGLTTRPTPRWPTEQPVSASKLHQMLHDAYYAGYVVYKGDIYPGRHEAIICQELFDRVQDVLDARSGRGQRDRILTHYLKGLLFCDRCRQVGREARMIYTEATGRNGTRYPYFMCRARQEGACDLPHLRAEHIEAAIVSHYRTLQLPQDFASAVRHQLDGALADEQGSVHELHAALTRKLRDLDAKEERLLDLAADGNLPQAKIRARLHRITVERQQTDAGLARTGEELAIGAEVLTSALRLVDNPYQLYADMPDTVRRQLNHAFYERLYINEDGVGEGQLMPLFEEIRHAGRVHAEVVGTQKNKKSPRGAGALLHTQTDPLTLADLFSAGVSSRTVLVGQVGLEPTAGGL